MTTQSRYDIVIVGAGPVGLATALGLHRHGIDNILVIDQTRRFRQAGQTVDLLPNGLKALRAISEQAYQTLKSANYIQADGSRKLIWQRRNLEGQVTFSIPLDFDHWFQKYGEGRISVPWYHIQTTLRNFLPAATIRINTRCVHLQEEDNQVSLNCLSNQPLSSNPFAHWETSQTTQTRDDQTHHEQPVASSLQAKIVIAADGINSTIRRLLYENTALENWARPKYSGYGAIGCLVIDEVPNEIAEQLENRYLQGHRIVTLTPEVNENQSSDNSPPRMILIRRESNTFGYLLHLPLARDFFLNSSPQALITLAEQALTSAGYPWACSQLIQLSDPEQLITRPYYLHPVDLPGDHEASWSSRRTVLVGDAAHGMPPFAAQGTNQGFEDALMIVQKLTRIFPNNRFEKEEEIRQMFQAYENERRPLLGKIQSATLENHLWTPQEWERYAEEVYGRHFPKWKT